MGAMLIQAAGPGLGDWARAWMRGLHPLRWLLCLGGVLVTAGLSWGTPSVLGLAGTGLVGWWQDPVEKAAATLADIHGASSGGILWAAGNLTLLSLPWAVIAGWIARSELIARRGAAGYEVVRHAERPYGSATELVKRSWLGLLFCFPMIFALFLFAALQVLLAAWVSGLPGGVGALVVSLLLPVVLAAVMILVVAGAGAAAWLLMPAAVAAEGSDGFDALARGYSYAIQRPLRFAFLTAVAVALAYLPVFAVLHALAWAHPAGGQGFPSAVFFLAAALSASIFWSLETLVYLHLRAAIDGVDASDLAAGPSQAKTAGKEAGPRELRPRPSPSDANAVRPPRVVLRAVTTLAWVAALWCLTVYLFSRISAGPTTWLDWGLTRWSTPPAGQVDWPYRAASAIAGIWALMTLTLPLRGVLRRFRSGEGPAGADQAAAARFLGSLDGFSGSDSEARQRSVALLGHPRFLIRVQAHLYLVRLMPAGSKFGYRAWAPAGRREVAIARWRELAAAELEKRPAQDRPTAGDEASAASAGRPPG